MGPTGTGQPTYDNDSDPTWLPLGAPKTNVIGKNTTPPFPAYPSGHATFGAAAFQITRLFYTGATALQRKPDALAHGLTFVSDELNGVSTDNKGTVRPRHVRRFDDGLWEMIEENGRSRVYLGVHWVFDAFAVKNNGKPDLAQNRGGVPRPQDRRGHLPARDVEVGRWAGRLRTTGLTGHSRPGRAPSHRAAASSAAARQAATAGG